jgi:hypothetical protein
MGQNVNYLLGNQSQLMGADPELYRQQLIQQEQARIGAMPVQNQLGAQLGGLLGRGISNVSNDRGFFEVTNPVLQNLQKIQSIYDTSMKESDPNDPMSFYTTLQKQFADAGLGRQALMAQLEGKKFEDLGLKTEAAKTALYKSNPALLDTQIAKARDAGNDKLANQLAEQRGQIQISIDTDRAMDVAKLGLVNAQTAAQRATASRQLSDIESSKSDWKPISEYDGGPPVAFAILDKKTKQITYEKIGGGEYIPKAPGAGGTKPPAGEKPNAASFDKRTTAPVEAAPGVPASPATATSKTVSLYDQNSGTYKLTQDPEYLKIVQFAAANQQQLETDTTFQAQIQQAMNQLKAKRQQELGSAVKFQ